MFWESSENQVGVKKVDHPQCATRVEVRDLRKDFASRAAYRFETEFFVSCAA